MKPEGISVRSSSCHIVLMVLLQGSAINAGAANTGFY